MAKKRVGPCVGGIGFFTFTESLNLKTGQGISYSGNITSPNREITLHGNEYEEMNKIHNPRGFEMIQINDSNDAVIVTPELRAFTIKVGVPHCAGKNNRKEFLPFNIYPFGLVNE